MNIATKQQYFLACLLIVSIFFNILLLKNFIKDSTCRNATTATLPIGKVALKEKIDILEDNVSHTNLPRVHNISLKENRLEYNISSCIIIKSQKDHSVPARG